MFFHPLECNQYGDDRVLHWEVGDEPEHSLSEILYCSDCDSLI